MLDGFGNHDPGAGRYNQQRSPWDVIHPGPPWAQKLRPNIRSRDEIPKAIAKFLGWRIAHYLEGTYRRLTNLESQMKEVQEWKKQVEGRLQI